MNEHVAVLLAGLQVLSLRAFGSVTLGMFSFFFFSFHNFDSFLLPTYLGHLTRTDQFCAEETQLGEQLDAKDGQSGHVHRSPQEGGFWRPPFVYLSFQPNTPGCSLAGDPVLLL